MALLSSTSLSCRPLPSRKKSLNSHSRRRRRTAWCCGRGSPPLSSDPAASTIYPLDYRTDMSYTGNQRTGGTVYITYLRNLWNKLDWDLWSISFYGAMSSFSINVFISIRNMDLSLTIDKQVKPEFVLTLQVHSYHIMLIVNIHRSMLFNNMT